MPRAEKNRSKKADPLRRSAVSRRALMIGAAAAGALAVAGLLRSSPSFADPAITVWKSPDCGCCGGWVSYMRGRGYDVTVNAIEDMDRVKAGLGVPESLRSCHTARVEGYLLEGHVPEAAVAKLLSERPEIKGLALPGMPEGAPGMDGQPGSYQILAFDKDVRARPFMTASV